MATPIVVGFKELYDYVWIPLITIGAGYVGYVEMKFKKKTDKSTFVEAVGRMEKKLDEHTRNNQEVSTEIFKRLNHIVETSHTNHINIIDRINEVGKRKVI